MTAPRFFLLTGLGAQGLTASAEPNVGDVVDVPLSAADLHHAADVLRLQPGEVLTVAEPSGVIWRLRAEQISRDALTARVMAREESGSAVSLTLVQGVAKGPKMDRIVEQAVEIGATAIIPVLTERCIVRLDKSKRTERGQRWRRVAEAAAKQARRESVPRVLDPVSLGEAATSIASHDVVLVVWEQADPSAGISRALADAGASSASTVAVVVGPEGGLSQAEVERLQDLGAAVCTLGPAILRTETAGLVALALVLASLGGLGAGF